MATVRFSIAAMRVFMVAERLAEDWSTMADMSVKDSEEVGSTQLVKRVKLWRFYASHVPYSTYPHGSETKLRHDRVRPCAGNVSCAESWCALKRRWDAAANRRKGGIISD